MLVSTRPYRSDIFIPEMLSNNTSQALSINATVGSPYTLGDVIFTSILYYTISTAGAIATGLVLAAIIKDSRFHTTGYALLVSLGTSELMSSLLKAFISHSLSIYVWRQEPHVPPPSPLFLEAAGLISVFAYEVALLHMLIIAVNRLCAVIYPAQYSNIFDRRLTTILIIAAWILAFLSTYPQLHGYASYIYDPHRWGYNLSKAPGSFYYFLFHQAIAILYIISSSIIYGITIRRIRQVRRTLSTSQTRNRPRKEDMQLTMQFFAVSCVFVASWIVLAILLLSGRNLAQKAPSTFKYLTICRNILWFGNHSINSIIYLSVNVGLRNVVKDILHQVVEKLGCSTCIKCISTANAQDVNKRKAGVSLNNVNKSTSLSNVSTSQV